MENQFEKSTTQEVIIAGVACNVRTVDVDRVVGLYEAVCRGPFEELRKDYIMLMAKRDEFLKAGRETLAKGIQITMDAMLEDKWADVAPNLVTTVGKKWLLDLLGSGSTYTANFMMLISSIGYASVPVVGDTMASHGTWFEVDATPHFPNLGGTGLRLPVSFSAASGTGQIDKTGSAVSWTIGATGGTLKGCALNVNGTSALGNTTGILYSAGLFSGGDKVVNAADTLNVTYTTSLAA
jgi:hypothetical protein